MPNDTRPLDEPKPPPSTSDTSTSPDTSPPDTARSPRLSTATSRGVIGPVDFSELPGLPRLRYRILDFKVKLAIVVFLLVLESSLLPISLYYGLILGRPCAQARIVFAIITSFFGIVTGIEFGLRCLKLILKGDTYRPVGGTRWSFDFTHWTLSFGYTVMTGILIGASIPHNPLVRPLAIPVSLFFIQVGCQLVWTAWMNKTGRPAPCKISSVSKGGRVPPLVLTIVEDIVGVDGAGGREYRNALWARYEASPRFRKMIWTQNWFWAVGALIDGIGTLVVIWTVPERVAYGVGKFFKRRVADLCALLQASKHFYHILWEVLYTRDRHHPVGLIRCILRGVRSAVAKFIEVRVDANARVECEDGFGDNGGMAFEAFPFTYPLLAAVVGREEIVGS
ncbi:hypothetical protein N0V88_007289 [Collariella sp. IMI 366227]|nr:hypothetical protein N0V88_007289 [Collariella sp. IMI 366227]